LHFFTGFYLWLASRAVLTAAAARKVLRQSKEGRLRL
jgi:hypothetical protein